MTGTYSTRMPETPGEGTAELTAGYGMRKPLKILQRLCTAASEPIIVVTVLLLCSFFSYNVKGIQMRPQGQAHQTLPCIMLDNMLPEVKVLISQSVMSRTHDTEDYP
jgi:hypothetical protein